jgi:TusA-related sulfurtransferase
MSASLDLRGVRCPMNLVRVKLALEPLSAGETLSVVLDAGESMENVPRAVADGGHAVLSEHHGEPCRLLIRKGG